MKLWNVSVEVEISMPVFAETEEEAEEIALENYEEEPQWGDSIFASAREITFAGQLPTSFAGSIPWGAENDETCEAILARSRR